MTSTEYADPAEVRAKIDELVALEAADRLGFREALATNIMEPDPVETAAFRSDELAFMSFLAAQNLIKNADEILRQPSRKRWQQRGTRHFQDQVRAEARLLKQIADGVRARNGMTPNAPNPTQRAMRRLATENLAGDVPRGRFRDLVNEEKEKDRVRAEQEKRARKDARRAARAAGQK